jgi:hypothetical protein
MRRRLLLSLGLLLLVGGLGLALVLWFTIERAGVTRANFERVKQEMSRADVEVLFGGTAQEVSPGGRNWSILGNGPPTVHPRTIYGGDGGAAVITFDRQGRVVSKEWYDSPESFLNRVRRWLRL